MALFQIVCTLSILLSVKIFVRLMDMNQLNPQVHKPGFQKSMVGHLVVVAQFNITLIYIGNIHSAAILILKNQEHELKIFKFLNDY